MFDSLRPIAALNVFLGHTIKETYTFAPHRDLFLLAQQIAYQGVAIFFLISGFLLYRAGSLVLSVSAVVTCACAAASYYVVERSMMRLKSSSLVASVRRFSRERRLGIKRAS